jgi:hypothetical protein
MATAAELIGIKLRCNVPFAFIHIQSTTYAFAHVFFVEGASDHFGLDQYYESSEHLVEHIK